MLITDQFLSLSDCHIGLDVIFWSLPRNHGFGTAAQRSHFGILEFQRRDTVWNGSAADPCSPGAADHIFKGNTPIDARDKTFETFFESPLFELLSGHEAVVF